jgi:hypothetical protein
MINTTDFLNALRYFEYEAEQKHIPTELKIKVRDNLLNELEKLKGEIKAVDLGEEIPEIIHGVKNALKDL